MAVCPIRIWGQSPNTPTNQYFGGLAAPLDRNPSVDISSLPPIRGLKYRSCYFVCPQDSCYAARAIFALLCPEKPGLLRWVSSRAEWFAQWCASEDFDLPSTAAGRDFTTSSELLGYYIRKIKNSFQAHECENTGPDANQQYALLITPCCRIGSDLTTFYEATWFDHLSASYTVRESYFTVKNEVGEALGLKDIIAEEKISELAELMLRYLKDWSGNPWPANKETEDPVRFLLSMNGCALLPEGLVIFFHPYQSAPGVFGQLTALIPYKELNGYLKIGFSSIKSTIK